MKSSWSISLRSLDQFYVQVSYNINIWSILLGQTVRMQMVKTSWTYSINTWEEHFRCDRRWGFPAGTRSVFHFYKVSLYQGGKQKKLSRRPSSSVLKFDWWPWSLWWSIAWIQDLPIYNLIWKAYYSKYWSEYSGPWKFV